MEGKKNKPSKAAENEVRNTRSEDVGVERGWLGGGEGQIEGTKIAEKEKAKLCVQTKRKTPISWKLTRFIR